MHAYHATSDNHGDAFRFDRGGHFEKVDAHGRPQQRIVSGHFGGFEVSNVPELAASKSPAAAVFAEARNLAEGSANTCTQPITIHVYRLGREPDVDLTDAVVGDFALLEEVRYRRPDETPIDGERTLTVTLPGHVLGDIDLAYLPDGPHLIDEWGEAVKRAVSHAVDGGEYPDDVAEWAGVESPDIAAYRP